MFKLTKLYIHIHIHIEEAPRCWMLLFILHGRTALAQLLLGLHKSCRIPYKSCGNHVRAQKSLLHPHPTCHPSLSAFEAATIGKIWCLESRDKWWDLKVNNVLKLRIGKYYIGVILTPLGPVFQKSSMAAYRLAVAENHQLTFGSCQSHVHTPCICHKPNCVR